MGLPEQGAPLFVGEVERGLFLFPWRPEERDSSLGGRYFNAKRDPSTFCSKLPADDFLTQREFTSNAHAVI